MKLKTKSEKRKTITQSLKFLVFSFALLTSACGGDHPTTNPNSGAIKAVVTNSKSFNPNISHGQITQYKVTITAPDLAEPLEATFDGSSQEGTVENVPTGSDRQIKVEAINSNSKRIREGEAANLEVKGGEVTEAEVAMESVPTFANIDDGNVIPNTRFVARLFSEPGKAVTIEDDFNGTTLPLLDIATANTEIMPDASTGLSFVAPPLMPVGGHRLTVKDIRTNRATTVTVNIIDGTKAKPAPLFSAGSTQPARFGTAVLGFQQ